jgi:hypothetical protein
MSSNFSNPIEKKAYDVISKFPFVSIYDTKQLDIVNQGFSLSHCKDQAHLEKKAEWVVDFDIDEVFAFGDAAQNTSPNCQGNSEDDIPALELSRFASGLPNHVLAVVLPRLVFGQNGVKAPPTDRGTQMDLYTQRGDRFAFGAKIMLRTNRGNMTTMNSKHTVFASSPDAVVYPCGEKAVAIEGTCNDENGMCEYWFDMNNVPVNMKNAHLSAPRLHHYQSRSLEDCWRKINDSNATWRLEQEMSTWRLENSHWLCNEDLDIETPDYSVYCASQAVAWELSDLFPSFDNAPYVF